MNLAIRSAVGLAVAAALSGNAYALNKSDYANMTKVYFGGATATDNVLTEALVNNICDISQGLPDVYYVGTTGSSNNRVVACIVTNTTAPGHGFGTGTKVAFHKESQGGSSNGVNPLIAVSGGAAHGLRWLDLGALTSDCTVTSLSDRIDHTNCSAALTPVDTAASATYDVHGGISDLEPSLSFPKPTTAEIARLNVKPGVAIVMGVPVTTGLYRALQKAQFGVGSACDGSDATNSCVPSLTRAQVRALYTQNITDWNDIKGSTGAALTTFGAPTDEFVRICRRVATSGTQASFETYFLNERCIEGGVGFAVPDDSSTVTDTTYSANQFLAGSLVNAAPSSGNVRTCMSSANTNGFWAVGILSTEVTDSNYGTAGATGFRFVGIDGAAPNLTNVANGDYDFFVENTINRIKTGPGTLADGDLRREVIEAVEEKLGNTAAIASLNADFDGRPWGNGGILALGTVTTANTAPYSDAELTSSPVNTMTRGGNNCVPPYMIKAQPANGTPNP